MEVVVDIRDVLIAFNIAAMVGGALTQMAVVRTEVKNLAEAIDRLRSWLSEHSGRVNQLEQDVAILKDRERSG